MNTNFFIPMKKTLLTSLVLGLTPLSFAIPAISPVDIHQDFFSADGIQIVPVGNTVVLSDDQDTYKKIENEVTLSGTGTLTMGHSNSIDYPRIQLIANDNTITKTKVIYTQTTNDDWDGTIKAPQPIRQPDLSDIETRVTRKADTEQGIEEERATVGMLGTYIMGLEGETFEFSRSATVAFEVDVLDGSRVWFAVPKNDASGEWEQTTQSCIVNNKVCEGTFNKLTKITLLQEAVAQCPDTDLDNGKWGSAPDCRIICDSGYESNTAGTQCVEVKEEITLADLEAENNEGVETNNVIVESTPQPENITPLAELEDNTPAPVEAPAEEAIIETPTEPITEEASAEVEIAPVTSITEEAPTEEVNDAIIEPSTEVTAETTPAEIIEPAGAPALENNPESNFNIEEVVEDELLPSAPKNTANNAYGSGALLPTTGSSYLYVLSLLLISSGLFLSWRRSTL